MKSALAIHSFSSSVFEVGFFNKYGESILDFIIFETVAVSSQRIVKSKIDLVPFLQYR